MYPLECNCRVHSQFSVFSTSQVGRAVFGSALLGADNSKMPYWDFNFNKNNNQNGFATSSAVSSSPISSSPISSSPISSSPISSSPISSSSIKTLATGETFHYADELFKLLRVPNYDCQKLSLLSVLGREMQDADLNLSDPLPFFFKIHLQIPSLLIHNFISDKFWKKIDFCIGKVVELDGE